VFSAVGSYATPVAFVHGLTSAVWVGAGVVGLAGVAAATIPRRPAEAAPVIAPFVESPGVGLGMQKGAEEACELVC